MQVPVVISVWDDGYGISVANDVQMTKSDVSEVLKGFQRDEKGEGFEIMKVKGWDYPELIDAYEKAEKLAREQHIPSIIHVVEMTQPTGHSTSGSHERYKSKERLQWEEDFDCIKKFGEWIVESKIANKEELDNILEEVKEFVKQEKKEAWKAYQAPLKAEWKSLSEILNAINAKVSIPELEGWMTDLNQSVMFGVFRRDYLSVARKVLGRIAKEDIEEKEKLSAFITKIGAESKSRYNSKLYNETVTSARNVQEVLPTFMIVMQKQLMHELY